MKTKRSLKTNIKKQTQSWKLFTQQTSQNNDFLWQILPVFPLKEDIKVDKIENIIKKSQRFVKVPGGYEFQYNNRYAAELIVKMLKGGENEETRETT